jgi:hypothetical protein
MQRRGKRLGGVAAAVEEDDCVRVRCGGRDGDDGEIHGEGF